MGRDEDLFQAANAGNLDDLNKLLAAGAGPSGFNDRVRAIAEDGRTPPHPLCGLIRRVSVRRLSVASSSFRPRVLSGVRRFVESSPPESAAAVVRVVISGHIRSAGRATPIPIRGYGGRGLGANWRDDADGGGGYFGRCGRASAMTTFGDAP